MDQRTMSSSLDTLTPAKAIDWEFGSGRRLHATEPRYLELLSFLWDEAAVLDHDDLSGWRDLLETEIRYRMPVCVTRSRRGGGSFETEAVHFDEDYASLCFRIRRFLETQAWAADPPTRARRFVTGVRAWEGRGRGVYDVASSLLLVRTSDDDFKTDLVTAERSDRIRFDAEGAARLLER